MAAEIEIVSILKPRYKDFLEGAFRQIAPTKAAMEYRKQLLQQLLDRTQELNIRGIVDPDLIFKTTIDELGDIVCLLNDFEEREQRSEDLKHKLSTGTAVAIAVIALIAIVYVIVGAATGIWHPTWLILLGGIFSSLILLMIFASLKLLKKRKVIPVRFMIAASEILVTVFIFLLLQLVFHISKSWLIFLAMVAMLFGSDTAMAFLAGSKGRWIELPIFIEVLCVMLYVILGIALAPAKIWHPGWLLCLGGVAVAVVEFICYTVGKSRAKDAAEEKSEGKKQDEAYWTQWDD